MIAVEFCVRRGAKLALVGTHRCVSPIVARLALPPTDIIARTGTKEPEGSKLKQRRIQSGIAHGPFNIALVPS